MPRPKKCRKVCQMPQIREFHPLGRACGDPAVILTVDEYEAIRLIDRQGFSQEECSAYMQIARTTVQLIYNSARKKIAEALERDEFCALRAGTISFAAEKKSTAAAEAVKNTVWAVHKS